MADNIPYATAPHRVKEFLEKIPSLGIPAKMSVKELELRGFRSSNDRSILRVLKAIGLMDDSGTPSDAWRQYRNRNTNRVLLARLIRATYSDLFSTFPNAQEQTETELMNFMSTITGSPAGTVQFMVKTFKMLCSLADFDDEIEAHFEPIQDEGTHQQSGVAALPAAATQRTKSTGVSLVTGMQINLHLPASENPAIYDAIFKSFARHILRYNDDTENKADANDADADRAEVNA